MQIRTVFLEGLLRSTLFLPSVSASRDERERAARDRLVRLINAATADRNLDWRNGEGKREVGRRAEGARRGRRNSGDPSINP